MKELKRLEKYWIDIYLTIVSIIQGLIFTFLAEKLPLIIRKIQIENDYAILIPYFLSILIVIRFFQSQLTAALAYIKWKVSVSDLLVIFFTGFFEYFLFSEFLNLPDFNNDVFYSRVSFMGLLGVISFIYTLKKAIKLFNRTNRDSNELLKVKKVQFVNIFCTSLMAFFSFYISQNDTSFFLFLVINLAIILMLIFNIKYSLDNVFYFSPSRSKSIVEKVK